MAETTPNDSARFKRVATNLKALNNESDKGTSDRSKMAPRTAGIQIAPDKNRRPLDSYRSMGIVVDSDNNYESELSRLRGICREYYRVHHLVPTAIDIYSRFPVQGMEFDCKDEELVDFYTELFLENLDYKNFLVDFGREFFISGEATSLGDFNETLGVWTSEEILNPDQLTVDFLPLERDYRIRIEPPDYLKNIVTNQDPIWEFRRLQEEMPDLVKTVSSGERIEVSPTLISRMVNKTSPWDLRGTPHLLRSMRQLMMEESLNAAQDAVADRLYSPFVLAKLGMQDIGDGQPWIPNSDQIAEFNDALQQALLGDFKLMTHHFGVDIHSVFGRESMPRFDQDYDRIEKKILQTWGIGESLLSGSSSGAYASSALNRELVTQLMTTYQNGIVQHYRKRALVVAEAQGHFDYELKGGRRVPIYEEVLIVDEEGYERVEKRPKLLIPEIKFQSLNLRDEEKERQFLQNLKNAGVPISDRALALNIDIDIEEETEKSLNDKVRKTVAEQEYKVRVVKELVAKDLPIPAELKDTYDGLFNKVKSVDGDPEPTFDDSGKVDDISEPVDSPNVAPDDDDSDKNSDDDDSSTKSDSGDDDTNSSDSDDSDSSDGNTLPRNEIRQRPEISDDMRSSRIGRKFSRDYKSVEGLRGQLNADSVEDFVNKKVVSPKGLRRVIER